MLGEPAATGHLLHFAVHGLSNPEQPSDRSLLLVDGEVSSTALAGGRPEAGPPRFCFVFINACQVGAAQETLGQAAGFGPDLLEVGTAGFVAPLWDVHGEVAFAIAKRFYAATLAPAGETVGAALVTERASHQRDGSATPLAYIYYGHPDARLHRRTS